MRRRSLGHVVEVLYADDVCDGLCLSHLLGGDSAESNMPDQALLFEFDERGERLLKGFVHWTGQTAKAKIDHVERIKAKIPQVVVHGIDNFLA